MVKQLTDEISKMINQQTNDKFKKVLKQVIQGNQQAREQFIKESDTQTDQTSFQLEKQLASMHQRILDLDNQVSYQTESIKEFEYQKAQLNAETKLRLKFETDAQQLQETLK